MWKLRYLHCTNISRYFFHEVIFWLRSSQQWTNYTTILPHSSVWYSRVCNNKLNDKFRPVVWTLPIDPMHTRWHDRSRDFQSHLPPGTAPKFPPVGTSSNWNLIGWPGGTRGELMAWQLSSGRLGTRVGVQGTMLSPSGSDIDCQQKNWYQVYYCCKQKYKNYAKQSQCTE